MKQTGRIELSPSTLIPNERGLWFSAFEKLAEAQQGINEMGNADNRVSYVSGWVRFVDSLEESWTSFYFDGKNKYSNFETWANKIHKSERNNGLLKYCKVSRDQSQHGNIILEWTNAKTQIAPNFNGHIKNLKIFSDQTFEAEASSLGNNNVVTLVHSFGEPLLPSIYDARSKSTFHAPTEHLGSKLTSNKPEVIANIALNYYKDLYKKASEKFCKNKLAD